jgi:hypothetical protein
MMTDNSNTTHLRIAESAAEEARDEVVWGGQWPRVVEAVFIGRGIMGGHAKKTGSTRLDH